MIARKVRPKTPILMYHSISDRAHPRFRKYAVSPARFAEQLAYLQQQQYTTLTVSQYAKAMVTGAPLPQPLVVLTFDDGFADFYTEALPTLNRYGFVATLYLPTAFVSDTSRFLRREHETARPMLTWSQLLDVSASGIECGAHSHRHLQLDVLPMAVAHDEIARSKQILEEKLSREVASFAYPYGYYRPAVKQLVQAAGYSSACAVRYRMSSPADDVFALSRLIVSADIPIKEFAQLLAGRRPQLEPAYERGRAWVWRWARVGLHALKPGYFGGDHREPDLA
jgi:peptidoglycan/xylan/chitin deacetylase (PgdA/CDA1 family)